jgi:DNA-binding transcriptional LysR family regulator
MDIELRHCRALLALAEHRGIARTARALGMAQSTLSETLFSLERVVGFAVTERTPGTGATMTAQARALLPHARRLVQLAGEALEFAQGMRPQASFAIGASESVGTYILPGLLDRVREACPSIVFNVRTGLCSELRQLVATGKVQVALTIGPSIDEARRPGQTLKQLAHSRLSIFRSKALAVSELSAGPPAPTICVPDPEGSLNFLLSTWLHEHDIAASLRSAGSVEAVKRSVFAGAALGALPLYAIGDELAHGEFVELMPAHPLPAMVLEASMLNDAVRSEPLLTLLDALSLVTLQGGRTGGGSPN